MTAVAQAALALVLALGLHLGGFVLWSGGIARDTGAVSAGAGGADLATLQASDAQVADLVAAWTAPPRVSTAPPVAAPVAPAAMTAPVLPRAAPPPPPPLAPPSMGLPAMADTAPAVDPPPALAPPPEVPKVRPQARPAKPQASQPAQRAARAAGSGNGAQAGDGGAAPLATLSQGARADLQASWGAGIRARIERRKAYPAAAGGATGTVTVRLTVSRSGQLGAATVVQSSGHAALDQAALRAVASARLPKAPQGLTEASYAFTLPMTFAR